MPPNTLSKICSHEKTVLNYSSRTFCTEKLLKTPSTTSKHSSEKYRTKVLPTTPSMKRNRKMREMECSWKRYRRNMLPKTPLGIVIDENFSRKSRQKVPIKKTCPKQRQRFSFKRRPYWFSRQKVPCKGSVHNSGKNSVTAKTVLKYSSWFFERKSCLKHCRQYLNAPRKNIVQNFAHNTVNEAQSKNGRKEMLVKTLY